MLTLYHCAHDEKIGFKLYRQANSVYINLTVKVQRQGMQSKLDHGAGDPKKMFALVNQLPDKGGAPSVLADSDDKSSAESLSVDFTEKIQKIWESFSVAAASTA